MLKVAIPFYSGAGHTRKLASFIKQGVEADESLSAKIIDVETITDAEWEYIHESHGIIFGTPTYMGSIAAQYKLFLEKTSSELWLKLKWSDKIAGGFTVGSAPSGDKLNTLTSLALFAAEHGMIWAGFNHIGSLHTKDGKGINNDGSWLGLMATSDPDKCKLIHDRDERSAKLFGKRMGKIVKRWEE